ncbi:hypothetical protein [Mycolicibacter minnesotensis]
MTDPIDVVIQDYTNIDQGLPPQPIPPGPVHTGGTSPADAVAAALGAVINSDLAETNTQLAKDHADRTAGAADAVRKFGEQEADATSKFGDVAGQGDAKMAQDTMGGAMQGISSAMQGISSAMQGITGALSGVLGAVGKLPQEMMQAGQGALSPLMSAAQSLGKGGLGGASLASDISPGPGMAGSGLGAGGGGGLGVGTTPASNLGPPPVPGTGAPTTPTGSMVKTSPIGPAGGAPSVGGSGGGMMPMMPGGAGAGGKGGKDDKTDPKRIAAPGMPNGQPVKGRATAPPNIPVTKSVAKDPSQPGITPLRRIVDKRDPSQ